MTYKGFEIMVVCANKEDDIFGDIYISLDECKKECPDGEIIFGFYANADVNKYPYLDTPDWFYTLDEAIKWIDEQVNK